MSGDEFLDKLAYIDADLIEAADEVVKQKNAKRYWTKWISIAAGLCLIIISVYTIEHRLYVQSVEENKGESVSNQIEEKDYYVEMSQQHSTDDSPEDVVVGEKEPPVVTVCSGENQITATLGTYTWTYDNGDGTRTSVCADSSHPLEWKEFLTPLITTQGTMELGFAVEPQKYSIRRWSDEYWGKTDVAEEIVNVDNHTIELKQGGYIYEIVAEWTDEKLGEKNTVYYGFYVVFD